MNGRLNASLIEEFAERESLKGMNETTLKRKKREIERLFEHCRGNGEAITKDDILEYLDYRGKELSGNILNDKIGYIKEFFEFLLQKDEILASPAASIERLKTVPYGAPGVFAEGEIKRIMETMDDSPSGVRDRAILELLYSTGLRLGELLGLDLDDVDFRAKEITVRNGKGGKERIVPAGHEALNIIKLYVEKRREIPGAERNALFLGVQGKRLNAGTMKQRLKRWKEKAGLKKRGSFHAFRHSFASHMLARGAPILLIQRMLGHEKLSTTERYVHVFGDDLKRVYSNSHPKAKGAE